MSVIDFPRQRQRSRETPRELQARLRDTFNAVDLAAALSMFQPGDTYLIAALSGVEVATLRAGKQLDDPYDCTYHRHAEIAGPSQLMRWRYPPTGVPELWVKYGADGPPGWHGGGGYAR